MRKARPARTTAFRSSPRSESKRSLFLAVLIVFLATGVLYWGFANGTSSITNQERLQFVVYGRDTRVYSLGFQDGIHYVISYPAQFKIETPGGFGEYRVGALGHLASQEKDPQIIMRALSAASHSMVRYYFFHPQKTIWYESSTEPSSELPSFFDIFTSESNATLYDRIFLWQALARVSKGDVIAIPASDSTITNPGGDKALSNFKLQKQLEAYLFQEGYRKEDLNVQIIYEHSYKTADRISSILEGSGINVVDISQDVKPTEKPTRCKIAAASSKLLATKTATDLAYFFHCELGVEEIDHSDLQMRLGNVEKDWLIN